MAGPQHREIGTPISTGNASWRGPNTEKLEHQFQQAMQVGGAPTQRNWNTNFYRQCKLGRDRNKFCENIIFVLLPLSFLFQSRDVKILRKK
ncbi:hypothetical protein HMPREF2658_09220 [Staphylococcus sp. HMSC062H10]|nr:hypothetical protein HMPREF2658_09220 [Staphylococcus sp. HMSC062H10]